MVIYINSTVFNAGTQTIVNTVNCQGVMGAGLALEYKLRYPEMFEDYKNRCEQNKVKVGKPYLYRDYEKFWILNFPTKYHWKFTSNIKFVKEGLNHFVSNYQMWEIKSIAFPKLGTSKGGLDWNEVKLVMENYLNRVSIPVVICLDNDESAQGVEKRMVDLINNQSNDELLTKLVRNKRIRESLIQALPIKRFSRISDIPGVGKKTYEKLFGHFYKESIDPLQPKIEEQIPMFKLDDNF